MRSEAEEEERDSKGVSCKLYDETQSLGFDLWNRELSPLKVKTTDLDSPKVVEWDWGSLEKEPEVPGESNNSRYWTNNSRDTYMMTQLLTLSN